MKILKVTWMDTGGHPGWFTEEEMLAWLEASKTDYETVTIGFLWDEGDDYLALIRGWNGLGGLMDPIRIDKKAVIAVEELEYVETTSIAGNEEQEGAGEESREPVRDGASRSLGYHDSGTGRTSHL